MADGPPSEVTNLVERLLDAATVNHPDRQSGETFVECRMCGLWEEHEEDCPVPLLQNWLTS